MHIKGKQILCGSNVFFKDIKGFYPHDTDWVMIDETLDIKDKYIIRYRPGADYFVYSKLTREEFLNIMKNDYGSPLKLCVVILPEIIKLYKINIDHLKSLKSKRDQLPEKYEYLGIIYDSYIENNDFYLTDEQLMKSYEKYKQYRI